MSNNVPKTNTIEADNCNQSESSHPINTEKNNNEKKLNSDPASPTNFHLNDWKIPKFDSIGNFEEVFERKSEYNGTTIRKFTLPHSPMKTTSPAVSPKSSSLPRESTTTFNNALRKPKSLSASHFEARDLLPNIDNQVDLAIGKSSNSYRNIISTQAQAQAEAQSVFREFTISSAKSRFVQVRSPPVIASDFNIPPPPTIEPSTLKLQIKTEKEDESISTNLTEVENNHKDIEEARQARLISLGIFETNPKATKQNRAINPRQSSLNSFATPKHKKADKVQAIHEITGPILVETSSRVQAVELKEIWKDLKSVGRLVEKEK